MRKIVARYLLTIRLGASLVCVLLSASLIRDPVSIGLIVAAAAAISLSTVVLAYKAEVDPEEVCVRYLPFYTVRTPVGALTHLLETKTVVLVTAKSKIPIWGLPLKERAALFEILPRHLATLPTHPEPRTDSASVVRRHIKRTVAIAAAFFASLDFSVPFLKGNSWNQHVDSIGKYVVFFCLCMFLLLLFHGGFTYVLWSSKRDFDKIRDEERRHRSS